MKTGASQRTDKRLARAVFLLLLAVYTATFNGLPGGPDGEVAFQTTSSLWRTGSLSLRGTPEAEGLIEFARSQPPGGFSVRAGEGERANRFYGWYGIGQAIVALPFYGVGRIVGHFADGIQGAHENHTRFDVVRSEYFEHLFVGWRNPVLAALTAVLVALMVRRLGLSPATALVAGLGYGLASFAWPQARGSLSDVQGTFFVAWSLYLLLQLRQTLNVRLTVLFGVSCAFVFLTRVSLAPAVLLFDLAFLWLVFELRKPRFKEEGRLSTSKVLMLALMPQIGALVLWMGLNYLRFADPLDSGYGLALAGGLFGSNPLQGLLGLLISPGRGLLWMAPVLLLTGYGVSWARREKELNFVWLVLLLSASVLLPLVFMRGWHGAWSFGPRYLLPALPGLWTVAACGFQRSDVEIGLRPAVHFLLGVGLLIQLPGVLVDTVTYHDLAVQAAPGNLAVGASAEASDQAAAEFDAIQFDWGFAAPWAHWRILRHRVAHSGQGAVTSETFAAQEIFLCTSDLEVRPTQPRERGFRHLAWVDLSERLQGSIWPAVAMIILCALLGIVAIAGGLEP
ncbi:MAG: hypothetical protein ACI8X5_000343 [Planctomycetota bacterium]|jgi:hypothetical protein